MIGNITQGSGFYGLLRYLFHGSKEKPKPNRVAWTVQHYLAFSDPDRVATAMQLTYKAHRQSATKPVTKPVLHISISWHPDDNPSTQEMMATASEIIQRMHLRGHQAIVLGHDDTQHKHLHIVANRVHHELPKAWNAWQSKTRLEYILRDIERKKGWKIVPGRLAPVPGHVKAPRALLTRGEHLEALREGTAASPDEQRRVRLFLRALFRESTSWAELESKLRDQGLWVKRRGRGLVVTDGQRMIKASRIDRTSSKGKLDERFGQTFEEWVEQRQDLRSSVDTLLHHQGRRESLEQRFQQLDDPQKLQRLQRLKSAVDGKIAEAQEELRDAYRPIERRVREGRVPDPPGNREKLPAKNVWQVIQSQFQDSESWEELEHRLRLLGLRLARQGGQLTLTNGKDSVLLSKVDPDLSRAQLEHRFRQTFGGRRQKESFSEYPPSFLASLKPHKYSSEERFTLDPTILERLNRTKLRAQHAVAAATGNLRGAVVRPAQFRALRVAKAQAGALVSSIPGIPKIPPPTNTARTALATLNLVSRLLPPAASHSLRATIRATDLVLQRLGRGR